jgi:hypothetical protein
VPGHYRVVPAPVRAVVRSCHSSTTPTGPINYLIANFTGYSGSSFLDFRVPVAISTT